MQFTHVAYKEDAGSARNPDSAEAQALPAWPLPRKASSTHSGRESAWLPCFRVAHRHGLCSPSLIGRQSHHGEAFLTHFCRQVNGVLQAGRWR